MGMNVNVTVKSDDPERIRAIIEHVIKRVTGKTPKINMTNTRPNMVDRKGKN